MLLALHVRNTHARRAESDLRGTSNVGLLAYIGAGLAQIRAWSDQAEQRSRVVGMPQSRTDRLAQSAPRALGTAHFEHAAALRLGPRDL